MTLRTPLQMDGKVKVMEVDETDIQKKNYNKKRNLRLNKSFWIAFLTVNYPSLLACFVLENNNATNCVGLFYVNSPCY